MELYLHTRWQTQTSYPIARQVNTNDTFLKEDFLLDWHKAVQISTGICSNKLQ